jgi:pimeloyl-ACP methyl ester carboxylesterase
MIRRRSVLEILAAGTIAGVAATAWRGAARARAAEAAFPPEGQVLDVAGQRVHAVVRGQGPDLILIHGASGSSRDFTFAHVDRLASRFRVIALDRPGLGHSDPLPDRSVDPAAQARVLSAAVTQLGVVRPLLVGHSYGGAVAMAWALADPGVAAAVLLGGVSMPWEGGIWWAHEVIGGPFGHLFAPDPMPPGYIAHVGAELTLRRRTLRANSSQVAGLKSHITAMAARYPALALPIELVHGTEDTIVPAAIHAIRAAEVLPNARLSLLDGVGHMPHHARMDESLAAIDRAAARAGLR